NLVSFIELLHRYRSSRRLISVVRCDKPELAAVHPAIGIGHIERSLDAALHILAEFLGWASEWRGNAKPNFTIRYPAKGTADAAVLAERFRGRRERRLLPLPRRERRLCLCSCGRRRTRGRCNSGGWNERPICRHVICCKGVRWFGNLLSLRIRIEGASTF